MAPDDTRITCWLRLRSLRMSSTRLESHVRLIRPVCEFTSNADPTFTTMRRAVASGEAERGRRLLIKYENYTQSSKVLRPSCSNGTAARWHARGRGLVPPN